MGDSERFDRAHVAQVARVRRLAEHKGYLLRGARDFGLWYLSDAVTNDLVSSDGYNDAWSLDEAESWLTAQDDPDN